MRTRAVVVLGAIVLTVIPLSSQSSAQPPADTNQVPAAPKSTPAPAAPALPDSKTLKVIKRVGATYPIAAISNQMQGEVRLKLLINESGDVEDAQVIEGDDVFRKPAIDAAKKWKFEPFIRNGKPIKVATIINMDFAVTGHASDVKEPLSLKSQNPSSTSSETSASTADVPRRVRVSQGVSEGLLLHRVQPTYPPAARMNHIQGAVVLRAIIGKDGQVHDLKVISGPSDLVQSAMGAVRQWRYKPYYLLGEPVEVETQITVNYVLQGF